MMKKSFLAIGVAISLTIAGTAIYSVSQTTSINNKAILNNTTNTTNSSKEETPSIETNNKVSTKTLPDTQVNKNDTKQSQSHPTLNNNENNTIKIKQQNTPTPVGTNTQKTVASNSANTQIQNNDSANKNNTNNNENTDSYKATKQTNNNPNNNSKSNEKTSNTSSTPNTTNTQPTSSTDNTQNKPEQNLSPAQTYSNIVAALKKFSKPNTAFVTNLNNYHIVNGTKYYNVYEYIVGNKNESWNFDGNYSNFLGAFYVSANGQVLNMQFNQNYSNLSNSQKEAQILEVANQFVSYLPNQAGNISVDMSKTLNFEGYQCYLVHYGNNSFYMNPSGYIYVNKNQVFY
ncbi:MAG: hypothetical protein ACRC57_11290 [Sarcina sp.]